MERVFLKMALAGVAFASGCFSQFVVEPCRENRECQALNVDRGVSLDASLRWQCDRNANQSPTGFCRLMARDDDGDGDLHAADCDDMNPSRVSNGTRPEI